MVGRSGTEMLTNEAGEVTRFLLCFSLQSVILLTFLQNYLCQLFSLFSKHFVSNIILFGSQNTDMVSIDLILSHLQGMFTRTIRLLEAGIKPV